tara:strand:+ start:210 stop:809 length:600 start_codon:yes stop_codon:yes gene_type:complete
MIKQKFIDKLYNSLGQDLIDFWDMELGVGGVVRTEVKTGRIKAVYLIIKTLGNSEGNEWLKFTPTIVNGEQEFLIDSVYSKHNLYDDLSADEYRYTPDENRDLIATYKYLGRWVIGEPLATQEKNGKETHYLYGGYENIPDSVKNFKGVELNGETETVFWSDSDGDRHWSFLGISRYETQVLERRAYLEIMPVLWSRTN